MSRISLKFIKEDDERPVTSGLGYYARLRLGIMQYDAFRNRQITAVREERGVDEKKST